MRQILLIQSLILLATLSSSSGCSTLTSNSLQPSFAPQSRVYQYTLDEVWQATQKALAKYPLRVNNMDLGLLETDIVKGADTWKPPHIQEKASAGVRYQLKIRVIKGAVKNRPTVKVSIQKELSKTDDFFAKPKDLPSDGLEEKALLYRIQRELVIEKALQKAHQKNS